MQHPIRLRGEAEDGRFLVAVFIAPQFPGVGFLPKSGRTFAPDVGAGASLEIHRPIEFGPPGRRVRRDHHRVSRPERAGPARVGGGVHIHPKAIEHEDRQVGGKHPAGGVVVSQGRIKLEEGPAAHRSRKFSGFEEAGADRGGGGDRERRGVNWGDLRGDRIIQGVAGHRFRDGQRRNRQRHRIGIGQQPSFPRKDQILCGRTVPDQTHVFLPGRGRLKEAPLPPPPNLPVGHVLSLRTVGELGRDRQIRPDQRQIAPTLDQGEIGMELADGSDAVLCRSENHAVSIGREGHGRQRPLVLDRCIVGQEPAVERHRGRTPVDNLQPVGGIKILVFIRIAVVRDKLADGRPVGDDVSHRRSLDLQAIDGHFLRCLHPSARGEADAIAHSRHEPRDRQVNR